MNSINHKQKMRQLTRILFGRGFLSRVCFLIIVFFLLLGIFAPLLTPYGPSEQDLGEITAPPSREHLLGTDYLGRDMFCRIAYGRGYPWGRAF